MLWSDAFACCVTEPAGWPFPGAASCLDHARQFGGDSIIGGQQPHQPGFPVEGLRPG